MTAVYLQIPPTVIPTWLWMAALVVALGATPLLSWLFAALRTAGVRRVLVALVVALLMGAGTLYAADYCCCDPFWIIFWICLAP